MSGNHPNRPWPTRPKKSPSPTTGRILPSQLERTKGPSTICSPHYGARSSKSVGEQKRNTENLLPALRGRVLQGEFEREKGPSEICSPHYGARSTEPLGKRKISFSHYGARSTKPFGAHERALGNLLSPLRGAF